MIKLGANWRNVIKRAWSIRLLSLAIALMLADIAAVILETVGMITGHPGVSIALRSVSALITAGAFVARLTVQRDVQ